MFEIPIKHRSVYSHWHQWSGVGDSSEAAFASTSHWDSSDAEGPIEVRLNCGPSKLKTLLSFPGKKAVAPTLPAWKVLINKALPFYKATYAIRIPTKFDKG